MSKNNTQPKQYIAINKDNDIIISYGSEEKIMNDARAYFKGMGPDFVRAHMVVYELGKEINYNIEVNVKLKTNK